LCGLSPTLKSLHLTRAPATLTGVFELIYSFPLLEDLSLDPDAAAQDTDSWDALSTSSKFTGTLLLVKFHIEDVELKVVSDLVSSCSNTLQHLSVGYPLSIDSRGTPPLDLSKVTNLKNLEFQWGGLDLQWITTTLQTVQSSTFQQVNIFFCFVPPALAEDLLWQWRELDHALVKNWTSRSILPKVSYRSILGKITPNMMPGLTRRGAVYEIECGVLE